MLIKSADDHTEEIAELKELLSSSGLTSIQKKKIEDHLYALEKGAWGEHRAAYFINFHFSSSKNVVVLHDLRLVLTDGRTAQIDHLLIDRTLCIYVLESKNWKQLTVDKNGACTTWAGRIIGVESPLEQCKRHADILNAVFKGHDPLKELALRYDMNPRVLVAPACNLKAPFHQEFYLKADLFYSARKTEIDKIRVLKALVEITRLVSSETLEKLGHILAELHHPARRDWRAQFGISSVSAPKIDPGNKLVLSIEGLAAYVPRWGEDWFVLEGKPTEQTMKTIKASGYRAKKENGEWVWRLKI